MLMGMSLRVYEVCTRTVEFAHRHVAWQREEQANMWSVPRRRDRSRGGSEEKKHGKNKEPVTLDARGHYRGHCCHARSGGGPYGWSTWSTEEKKKTFRATLAAGTGDPGAVQGNKQRRGKATCTQPGKDPSAAGGMAGAARRPPDTT